MARGDVAFDPFAFDFARNEAELGGGIQLYSTDLAFQGGLQFNADYSPNIFGQTVAPILSSSSPWGWIILLVAFVGLIQLFKE
jgi:hypothetical protein